MLQLGIAVISTEVCKYNMLQLGIGLLSTDVCKYNMLQLGIGVISTEVYKYNKLQLGIGVISTEVCKQKPHGYIVSCLQQSLQKEIHPGCFLSQQQRGSECFPIVCKPPQQKSFLGPGRNSFCSRNHLTRSKVFIAFLKKNLIIFC